MVFLDILNTLGVGCVGGGLAVLYYRSELYPGTQFSFSEFSSGVNFADLVSHTIRRKIKEIGSTISDTAKSNIDANVMLTTPTFSETVITYLQKAKAEVISLISTLDTNTCVAFGVGFAYLAFLVLALPRAERQSSTSPFELIFGIVNYHYRKFNNLAFDIENSAPMAVLGICLVVISLALLARDGVVIVYS